MIRIGKIVDRLYKNNYNAPIQNQRNLVQKEYYKKLCDEVLKVLKENKDASLSELRDILFKESGLEESILKFFVLNKKAPGAVISFGTGRQQDTIVVGNSEEVKEENGKLVDSFKEMEEDSIFDLASVTKLFTSVAILQLAGEEKLRLDDPIEWYLPQFKNLGYHNIFNLLTYQPYYTEERIDEADSINDAERRLFEAKPYSPFEIIGKDRYNDIAPMILKYIVEAVSGMDFWDYVKKNILDKKGMNNTFVEVPEDKKAKAVNFNFSGRILSDGNFHLRKDAICGRATDAKAVALGQESGILSGHAGLFSTAGDLVNFTRGLIDGTILHPSLTEEMSKVRDSSTVVRSSSGIYYVPYYGFLCNSKHPSQVFSEVFQPLSGYSLSQNGWTGTHVTVDPVNDINLAFLSNRTHNRLVGYDRNYRKLIHEMPSFSYYTDENGHAFVDSTNFSFDKREITNLCLELALKEKILEEIIGPKKVKDETTLRKIK